MWIRILSDADADPGYQNDADLDPDADSDPIQWSGLHGIHHRRAISSSGKSRQGDEKTKEKKN